MARLITGDELRSGVEADGFIQDGNRDYAVGVKYDFQLGSRMLKAEFGRPIDYDGLSETEKARFVVAPGEVVFVLTEERLKLPRDMVAQLSPKRSLSHAGILTVGGLMIDPGYEGRLLFGLFNFSSTPWHLQPGHRFVAATFYQLEGSEVGDFPSPAPPLDDFPEALVEVMQKYRPVAVQAVADAVKELQTDLNSLRDEIRAHEEWYKRFKGLLDDIQGDLEKEIQARRGGQTDLEKAIQSIDKTLTFLRGAAWAALGILGIGVSVFFGWLFAG